MIRKFTRATFVHLAVAGTLVAAVSTASAFTSQRHPLRGWNVGLAIHMFEPNGTGNFNFPQGDYDFNVKRFDSRPLVDDNFVLNATNQVGLGWDNKQLIGLGLGGGYSWNQRMNAQASFRAFLPKNQELYYGEPSAPSTGTINYLRRQETNWWQWGIQARMDYAPIQAISIWYFSLGAEYTWFKTQLRYDIYQVNSSGARVLNRRESSSEAHTAAGILIGTGLNFREVGSTQVTSISLNYTLTKYSGPYFKRSGDFYVGGLTLEMGYRFKVDTLLNRFRPQPEQPMQHLSMP
jgi:hypothetical protein